MPEIHWQVLANDRYRNFVTAIISVSVGALVLPATYFKDVEGLSADIVKVNLSNGNILSYWLLLIASFLFGCSYFYISAKWVKACNGANTLFDKGFLEALLDLSFRAMIVCFFLGFGVLAMCIY